MRAVQAATVHAAPASDAEALTTLVVGEPVEPRERRGAWLRVVLPAQPSSLDPAGYPGWVPVAAVVADEDAVLAVARTYLGTPYRWGGLDRDGVDCSGLVHLAFRACGVRVPRDARDQAPACTPVTPGDERAGDLWFFAGAPGGPITHVGFVAGPGTILHAPDRGAHRHVVEEPLAPSRRAELVLTGRLPG